MNTALSQSAHVNRDGPFGDRFWYWNGASGRRYIHTVYAVEDCPPMPDALYLAVRRGLSGERIVCAIGRFSPFCEGISGVFPENLTREAGIDEVHVHLLAETEDEKTDILNDLSVGLLQKQHIIAAERQERRAQSYGAAPAGLGPLFHEDRQSSHAAHRALLSSNWLTALSSFFKQNNSNRKDSGYYL